MSNFLENRIIFKDNTTLNDISVAANRFKSGDTTLPIVAADDALYFGAPLPFNHRYIDLSTVNTASAQIASVEMWNGNRGWKACVDVIDQTSLAGATFGQSGWLSWVPDKNEGWVREDTSGTQGSADQVDDLESLVIYDLYWVRVKFSADLDAGTAARYIGWRFSEDDDLRLKYSDLFDADLIQKVDSSNPSKSDYKNESFAAAQEIIQDLEDRGVIFTADQILNWEKFREASVHKVAEIIFRNFGRMFMEEKREATKEYRDALDVSLARIDTDKDGRLDDRDRFSRQGWMTR